MSSCTIGDWIIELVIIVILFNHSCIMLTEIRDVNLIIQVVYCIVYNLLSCYSCCITYYITTLLLLTCKSKTLNIKTWQVDNWLVTKIDRPMVTSEIRNHSLEPCALVTCEQCMANGNWQLVRSRWAFFRPFSGLVQFTTYNKWTLLIIKILSWGINLQEIPQYKNLILAIWKKKFH